MSIWSDATILSRIQFGFVISFHIIFPALTIGLASWLAVLEGLWLKTKHPIYKEIYQHWIKIFAICFGMGVVSGVVMSYQFGTNWAVFSHKVGNVIGPILAFEVLTAFFLEASFLGIMLFGWGRVSEKMHFISTITVAAGTIVSAFWILSVNSWMQTPAGFAIGANGIYTPTDWLQIVFNPSFVPRFFHMIVAAYLSTAFFVAGVGAWYLLRKINVAHAKVMFSMGMIIAVFVTPIQFIIGHAHGLNTLKNQPVKVAAMEGIWENERGANLNIIGVPDAKTETTKYALQIPKAASWVLTGDLDGLVKGLKNWRPSQRPPVAPVFYAFRIMVGTGALMLLTGVVALYLYFRKQIFRSRWFHRWCVLMIPSGIVAILAGWIVTEVGRQPYVVYGNMLTRQAVSAITSHEVSISLLSFLVSYAIVFSAGIYYIMKLVKLGPNSGDWHDTYGTHGLEHTVNLSDIFLRDNK